MKLCLVHNAHIYSPQEIGKSDILYIDQVIIKIGRIDQKALAQCGIEVNVIDAKNNFLVPGFIDPHAHLLGGSGENGGFSSQTPEISLSELVRFGITTVVGTLGVDTTMKTMAGLLAKAKGLNDEGLSAFIYTGGYSVPPTSIMHNVREDIMFIDEVIATGEIAIADERSTEPEPKELARVVVDTHIGGMLANKAGVTHFHVGEGNRRLTCLKNLMEYAPEVKPEWLYPTHVERSPELIEAAIEFTKKGCFVDMDVAEKDLAKNLKTYLDYGGKLRHLTISSDASATSPGNVYKQIRECILEHGFKLEEILPLVTINPAKILKLTKKGELKEGYQPSFVILDRNSYEIRTVVSRGKMMIHDGQFQVTEQFLKESDRDIRLHGLKQSQKETD